MSKLFGRKIKSSDSNDNMKNQDIDSNATLEFDKDSINLDEIIDSFVTEKSIVINSIERNIRPESALKDEIKAYLLNKNYKISDNDLEGIYKSFTSRIFGYGILDSLIEDDDISDIRIVSYDNIRKKVRGKRGPSGLKFCNEESMKNYITNQVASKNHITLSEINAIQRFADTTSSIKFILRIDITSEYVNSVPHPYLHIRKIPKDKDSLDDLMIKGMFDDEIKEYIVTAAKTGRSILICGKGGTGKTLLINALLEELPHDVSGLVTQEIPELFSKTHPELVFLEQKNAIGESSIQYSLCDEIRNGLVSDFDYIIVGEIKGPEAWDTVNAAYTDHITIASVHTLNSQAAPSKMVHYMKYSPNSKDMSEGDLLETLVGFDEIWFLKDFKIQEITQIAGFDKNKKDLILHPVYKYDFKNNTYERLKDDCAKIKEKIAYSHYKKSRVG